MFSRTLKLILALAAAIAGGLLAINYPLAQPLPIFAFVAFAALVFFKPSSWTTLLPGILPIVGLAPWTGWLTFEELDLLVLATVAGGYANHVFYVEHGRGKRLSTLLVVLSSLMAFSLLVSMFRGFVDAGGFNFGWYQGYNGPMNSIRIAKSFFLAMLLVPLLTRLHRQDEARLARNLGYGLSLGLGLASLAIIWERLAFTDLLNFSTDYRTTALFWEMHVGGAALDGWLVLTVPFAIWALRTTRTSVQTVSVYLLIGMASYACLTTFSRGLYLALILALPLLGWLLQRRTRLAVGQDLSESNWGPAQWFVSFALLGVLAALVFPSSGYRGLLALLGLIVVAISMPSAVRSVPRSRVIANLALGVAVGLGLVLSANFTPKGPYFLYAVLFGLTLAAIRWPGRKVDKTGSAIVVAGFSALAISAVNVSVFWGGTNAAPSMVGALIIIFSILVWGATSRKPLWPDDLRWQGTMLTVGIAVCGVVAVFSGGAYMGDRFSTVGRDADGRLSHWRDTVSMLQSPWDIVFGKGLGRFPANFFFSLPGSAFPGTYRIAIENGNEYLALAGARHPTAFGDLLRVSQRLNLWSQGPFELAFKVRAKTDVTVHAEVCEKHLLYVARCAIQNEAIKATREEWRAVSLRLDRPLVNSNRWYAPPLKMFSIGIENQGGVADIDDLLLTEPGSNNLLANPDFSNEMRHWFFSSDRDHMPWHAKNLQINTLFDQGVFGLVTSTLLLVAALWRLNLGRGSQHELAPYLTASIVGFLLVGLFDSLIDVPRLAFIYYLILMYSITLKESTGQRNGKLSRSPISLSTK
jgi:hypothetical protein